MFSPFIIAPVSEGFSVFGDNERMIDIKQTTTNVGRGYTFVIVCDAQHPFIIGTEVDPIVKTTRRDI
jgi:hypothetical protein